MNTKQNNLKPTTTVSFIVLFLLFNYSKLQIQVKRYGSFITQMVLPVFIQVAHTIKKWFLFGTLLFSLYSRLLPD